MLTASLPPANLSGNVKPTTGSAASAVAPVRSPLPSLVLPTAHPYRSENLASPHCMLGKMMIRGATVDKAMPDTGSNYNVVPDVSYLHHVQMLGPLPVDGIDQVNATHLGVMRTSHLTENGEVHTQDIHRTIVIPSCGTVLFGNNNSNFAFDSWNKQMRVLTNGDRDKVTHYVPVDYNGGTFTLPTYVHRADSPLTEVQIKNVLLEASGREVPMEPTR